MGIVATIGVITAAGGFAILRNWRGWGTRFYQFTIRLPLPGRNFYRDWGEATFRVMVGGGYVVGGIGFVIVAAVVALSSN
jgi:hypothetical protein